MKIVEFTSYETGEPVYINPDMVAWVKPTKEEGKTFIQLVSREGLFVKCPDFQVVSALRG